MKPTDGPARCSSRRDGDGAPPRGSRWPLLDPLYHAAAARAGRASGYAVLPVLLESIAFVGLGSLALRAALRSAGIGGEGGWLWVACVAALLLAWHLLHVVTHWGGRLRLVPRAPRRAFRADRLLVSALTLGPLAAVTAAGLGDGWQTGVGWAAIALAHLQCQVRWLARNKDLWAAAWEDTEQRTAFGPRHSGQQRRYWEGFFASLRAEKPDARVVDVGSGNLDVSQIAHAASSDFELHATDSAPVDVASFPWAKGLQFHRWTFEETDFPDDYLDALTSSNAIEYSKAFDVALGEAFRILRPGARAALLMHHPDSHVVEHFRQALRDIEKLREIGLDPAVERYLRTRDESDRAALLEKLAAMRRSGSAKLASDARLIEEFHRDPNAVAPWLAFKDAVARNSTLASDLCQMVAAHLADADTLRAHFERSGFELDRLERFDSGKGVVNWAVVARVPFRGAPLGLGAAFEGLENSLTRSLPRDVARELVRTLLSARGKSIRQDGDSALFRVDSVVPVLLELVGEELAGRIRVAERERSRRASVYSASVDAENPQGLPSILALRSERDAWIGGE